MMSYSKKGTKTGREEGRRGGRRREDWYDRQKDVCFVSKGFRYTDHHSLFGFSVDRYPAYPVHDLHRIILTNHTSSRQSLINTNTHPSHILMLINPYD